VNSITTDSWIPRFRSGNLPVRFCFFSQRAASLASGVPTNESTLITITPRAGKGCDLSRSVISTSSLLALDCLALCSLAHKAKQNASCSYSVAAWRSLACLAQGAVALAHSSHSLALSGVRGSSSRAVSAHNVCCALMGLSILSSFTQRPRLRAPPLMLTTLDYILSASLRLVAHRSRARLSLCVARALEMGGSVGAHSTVLAF